MSSLAEAALRRPNAGYRLGADIGGTFTDLVLVAADGTSWTRKVLSTPADYADGIVAGLHSLLAEAGLPAAALSELVHGTTVATNAILEGKGAPTALITTAGFRDVLELRRLRVPQLYDLHYRPPAPLVERRWRLEVTERLDAAGRVLTPLDEMSVLTAIEQLERAGVAAVAVCLLHSYRNPVHERRIGALLRQRLPAVYLSLSVDVLPEIREYERTSTTVINATIGPLVVAYIASLRHQLQRAGVSAPLSIMQSNGGIMAAAAVVERPAWIVESGPAAGLIAAQRLGQQAGWPDLISFDMGGTTAKAGLVEGGQLGRTTEYEVGAGISLSSRLIKGAGHALKLPVLDIAEVGAGGGSLVWLDRGGALKVGPQSAGAVPGPACYGRGGERPTVTDANVVLGYLNPQALAGGTVPIVAERARAALMTMIAAPLRLDLLTAAHGVHTLANATMIRAIKAVTTYRGRDPRDFNLLAFGGSGPVHAAAMAEELGLRRVIVPPAPGLFSAVGLLVAPPTRDLVQSFSGRTDILDPAALNAAYADLTAQAHALLTASPAPSPSTAAGPAATSDTTLALIESDLTRAAALVRPGGRHDPATTIMTERAADLRYAGQAYELTVSVPDGPLTSASLMALAEAFGREHQRTYGHRASDEPVELVNLRLTARLATAEQPLPRPVSVASQPIGQRAAFFGPPYGRLSTPILQRGHLEATPRPGPLIVEEYDATTVVPPGWQARRDRWDTIVLEHGSR